MKRNPGAIALVCLLASTLLTAPADAQRRAAASARTPVTPNGDLWLNTALGVEYAIDRRWSFHLDSQLQVDRDITRLRTLQVRPGFEYAISPNWAAAAGYVQFQRYVTALQTLRGPFQDLLYRDHIGKVAVTGRLRGEELFLENTALLVRMRGLVGVRVPIGASPWELALSDEIFVNLKVDGTGRQAGPHQNRAYVGFGRPLAAKVKMSVGYELDTHERNGAFRNVHEIKLGLVFRLN